MWIDYDYVGGSPSASYKILQQRRHGTRFARSGRAYDCGVTDYQS
jgi:hypothetical protein